jgi:hypothetical protein
LLDATFGHFLAIDRRVPGDDAEEQLALAQLSGAGARRTDRAMRCSAR